MQHRIRCAWSTFTKLRQELPSQSYRLQHRLHLFDAVVTPTITFGAGTHEKMLRTTQRRMLRLIIQTKRNYKKKNNKETGGKTFETTESARRLMKKLAHMVNVTKTDEQSTTSHEDNLEDWIEYVRRSTRDADEKMLTYRITNWIENTEETEVGRSPTNRNTKQRKMDQESGRVEPRTQQIYKDPKESGKTYQETGRRTERLRA